MGTSAGCSAGLIQAAGRIAIAMGSDAIAPLLCDERPLVRGEPTTPAPQAKYQKNIIEPAYDAGINARMR